MRELKETSCPQAENVNFHFSLSWSLRELSSRRLRQQSRNRMQKGYADPQLAFPRTGVLAPGEPALATVPSEPYASHQPRQTAFIFVILLSGALLETVAHRDPERAHETMCFRACSRRCVGIFDASKPERSRIRFPGTPMRRNLFTKRKSWVRGAAESFALP